MENNAAGRESNFLNSRLMLVAAATTLLLSCSACSSLVRGAATTTAAAAGTAAGGGIGYLIDPDNPLALAGGAVIGGTTAAAATALALGEDQATKQKGFDEGYEAGQADEIKRLYWAQQRIQQQGDGEGRRAYYTFPGVSERADGTRLVPHDVTLPIIEPPPRRN